jgi:hypothetical protein
VCDKNKLISSINTLLPNRNLAHGVVSNNSNSELCDDSIDYQQQLSDEFDFENSMDDEEDRINYELRLQEKVYAIDKVIDKYKECSQLLKRVKKNKKVTRRVYQSDDPDS